MIPVRELRSADEVREHARAVARRTRSLVRLGVVEANFYRPPPDPEPTRPRLIDFWRACKSPPVVMIEEDRGPKLKFIIQCAADYFSLNVVDLVSKRRDFRVMPARFAMYWACKQLTKASYPTIAAALGRVNHTSILHGVQRAEAMRAEDEVWRAQTDEFLEFIARSHSVASKQQEGSG